MVHCTFEHFSRVMLWIGSKLPVSINVTFNFNITDSNGLGTSEVFNNGQYICNISGKFNLTNGNIPQLLDIISTLPNKDLVMDRLINGILLTSNI